MELEYEYPLQLPIKKFEKVAVLRIYKNKELIETEDLFAQKDITEKNIFFKGIQNINHYLWQLKNLFLSALKVLKDPGNQLKQNYYTNL